MRARFGDRDDLQDVDLFRHRVGHRDRLLPVEGELFLVFLGTDVVAETAAPPGAEEFLAAGTPVGRRAGRCTAAARHVEARTATARSRTAARRSSSAHAAGAGPPRTAVGRLARPRTPGWSTCPAGRPRRRPARKPIAKIGNRLIAVAGAGQRAQRLLGRPDAVGRRGNPPARGTDAGAAWTRRPRIGRAARRRATRLAGRRGARATGPPGRIGPRPTRIGPVCRACGRAAGCGSGRLCRRRTTGRCRGSRPAGRDRLLAGSAGIRRRLARFRGGTRRNGRRVRRLSGGSHLPGFGAGSHATRPGRPVTRLHGRGSCRRAGTRRAGTRSGRLALHHYGATLLLDHHDPPPFVPRWRRTGCLGAGRGILSAARGGVGARSGRRNDLLLRLTLDQGRPRPRLFFRVRSLSGGFWRGRGLFVAHSQ